MPGTVNIFSSFVYPLSTDSFNLPSDLATIANQLDAQVGGTAVYWVAAHGRSSLNTSNRIMSHDGGTLISGGTPYNVPELVNSNWTVNQASNLIVDSSSATGLRWGLDYVPATHLIASGTAISGTVSFTSVPQGYQSLLLQVFTTDTTTGPVLVTETTGSPSATNGAILAIGAGSANVTAGSYWAGAGTNIAGCMEMTI
jgi:hypothetical protein